MIYLVPAFLCLAGLASAVPTVLKARDISASLLQQLNLGEQYAAAAYCRSNNQSPGDKVTCESGNCDLVEAATTKTSIEFENSVITDVTGFVTVDSTNRLIVVSFRGSSSVRNWLSNVDFGTLDTNLCGDCKAHQGFWRSWTESRTGILRAVKAAAAEYPGYGMMATGHSLGGAIATLCAAELRNAGYTVALYSYGAPKVGNAGLANYITAQPGGNYRVTHNNDLVPKLPTLWMGYRHFGPEYFVTSGDNEVVNTDDVALVTGVPFFRGNQGTITGSISAHTWYFNRIAACSPSGFEFKV